MSNTIELPWGDAPLKVDLPDQWTVLGELHPGAAPEIQDPTQAAAEALV